MKHSKEILSLFYTNTHKSHVDAVDQKLPYLPNAPSPVVRGRVSGTCDSD